MKAPWLCTFLVAATLNCAMFCCSTPMFKYTGVPGAYHSLVMAMFGNNCMHAVVPGRRYQSSNGRPVFGHSLILCPNEGRSHMLMTRYTRNPTKVGKTRKEQKRDKKEAGLERPSSSKSRAASVHNNFQLRKIPLSGCVEMVRGSQTANLRRAYS